MLSFQTTLVIDAKINKMCCTAKENICFFLSDRLLLSFRWFNCLAEILLIFGRNKLCPLFVNFAIGITYSYLWYGRRKEAGSRLSKEISAILLPAIFLYVGHTSKVWISARQFFSTFLFWYFSFLKRLQKPHCLSSKKSELFR